MKRSLALALVLLSVAAPGQTRRRAVSQPPPVAAAPAPPPPHDVHSAAQPARVRSTHLELDLTIDFSSKRIRGSVTHTIEQIEPSNQFIVDTRNLQIDGVSIDGAPAQWSLAALPGILGQPLTIGIRPDTRRVRIDYSTLPSSGALNWLEPKQTLGGVAPFLYTLTQPDRTRDWIPLQDTPGVRTTYDARVRVPQGLMALMSAENATAVEEDGIYEIRMPYSIPSYLIALAVGRVESRALDARTGFYAEPERSAEAAWDLQVLPELLRVAEQIMGPYPFSRYDVMAMPPRFGGGMEHPMLNFISAEAVASGNFESPPLPTPLLAHEIAHSWAGDSTTCATWSDTWLNEGMASYYTTRLIGAMLGEEREELGLYWERQNYESYAAMPSVTAEQKKLHRRFALNERASIFTPTNYSKGAIFLKTLEDQLGRARFDSIMQSWFRRYAFRWADERAFIDELQRAGVHLEAVKVEEWIYGADLPSNVTAPLQSALWERIGVQAARFKGGAPVAELDRGGWSGFELGIFLWQITDHIVPRMAELDETFSLSEMRVPSIHWFRAVARSLHGPAMPMFERYLSEGGPNVTFLYQTLAETPAGQTWARNFYVGVRDRYDANTRRTIEQILRISGSLAEAA